MSPLPARRETRTITLSWKGETYHISLGHRPEWAEGEKIAVGGKQYSLAIPELGPVAEVWVRGPKPGSDAWAFLQDVAHAISKELQSGTTPAQIAGRVMRGAGGEPLSLYGVLADAICSDNP